MLKDLDRILRTNLTTEVNVKRLKLNFSIFFILFKKGSFDFRHVFKNFDSNYLFLKLKLNIKYVYRYEDILFI